MRVFRVFVICMMAAMLASCGGQETAAPEQPEKKDVDEAAESTGPVTSMQEEMIVMGYSCTVPEAMAGMPEEE